METLKPETQKNGSRTNGNGNGRTPWLIGIIESKGLLPKISETERAALEAGTVWIDADIFSARLDWDRLVAMPWPRLTEREQAYMDGPTEALCHMFNEWDIMQSRDIPKEVWDFLKIHGFFGLLIPQEHGGQGFSAHGASTIFGKIASRSFGVAGVVLVPNALGPAELLWHYGTDAQQKKYLRPLATGQEVPCFALTEPEAGSDAASIQSEGVVFKKDDGTLWLRLNWRKRYITLAPVATLLGLACRVKDPQRLLGGNTDPGITCVLVPANTPGVQTGRRHDPMGLVFPNGPTEGHNVEVPIDQVIGGAPYVGKGWRMLMDCLSAGRGVSLPGQATGASKQAARIVGAYAGVRQQFGMSIGRFEGIEEPLARIASFTYMLDAARTFTCGAVDEGAKPSVVSAILKYVGTEMARKVAQDTMDVMGGAALCRGPHNLVSQGPSAAAIGITVEGANILTRTLIMFGQGAIRCHPYAQKELQSLGDHDSRAFLEALQHHITFFLGNITKTLAYFFTGGPTNGSGPAHPALNRAFRRVRWASTQFAVLVDMALITLGSKLKQKGHLSGRYADVLSWIFMGLATLRRFEADGSNKEDVPLVRWSVEYCLWQAQLAIEGIWDNFPVPALPTFFGTMARLNPLGHSPKDELTSEVARILTTPGPARDRLTGGLYHPTPDEPLGRLEEAFRLCAAAGVVETKVRKAIKRRQMPGGRMEKILEAGIAANVITADEAMTWKKAQDARRQVIEVDSFDLTEYLANK